MILLTGKSPVKIKILSKKFDPKPEWRTGLCAFWKRKINTLEGDAIDALPQIGLEKYKVSLILKNQKNFKFLRYF